MRYSDESYNLRIELDTKHYDCSAEEIREMEDALEPLSRVSRDFPVSDLYITVIHHPRSKDFHVKTSLVLSGKTLFTGDRDANLYPAYERCVRKLVRKVETYKEKLTNAHEFTKQQEHTHVHVEPGSVPDHEALQQAVGDGDYVAFRRALDAYDDSLQKRIGRWIQRYPEVEAQLGATFTITDIAEEVFLNAFEQFEHRPPEELANEWLEGLIDPSVKALLRNTDEELENIRFARTSTETRPE